MRCCESIVVMALATINTSAHGSRFAWPFLLGFAVLTVCLQAGSAEIIIVHSNEEMREWVSSALTTIWTCKDSYTLHHLTATSQEAVPQQQQAQPVVIADTIAAAEAAQSSHAQAPPQHNEKPTAKRFYCCQRWPPAAREFVNDQTTRSMCSWEICTCVCSLYAICCGMV